MVKAWAAFVSPVTVMLAALFRMAGLRATIVLALPVISASTLKLKLESEAELPAVSDTVTVSE